MSSGPILMPVAVQLLTRRVRAYFAPVSRSAGQPTLFDPAVYGSFDLDSPPSPWIDLGWIDNFERLSQSITTEISAGVPSTPQYQVRDSLNATVSFRFKTWSKLTMALGAGSQHMNVLAPAPTSPPLGSGAKGLAAMSLDVNSTATTLAVSAPGVLSIGDMVAVDIDYLGQTGFVGSGVSAAYVSTPANVGSDPDYIRRVTFNVGRIVQVSPAGYVLAQPLPAGNPVPGMKVQQILGFVDREGGSFFQEWSGLFVLPGEQGDRLLIHYPRLQATTNSREAQVQLASPLESVLQVGAFRALPVVDENDGEQVLSFRTYLPAAAALI